MSFTDRNSERQSLRYEEDRKAVSERRQEQSSTTLYRNMLIPWSWGFVILLFLYQIKAKEGNVIVSFIDRNSELQSLRYEKNVRRYQKEGRNNQVRRCTGKCSYAGHRVSEV